MGKEAYGGLQFDNFWVISFLDCKFDETCHPESSLAEDRQLAPQHEDAEALQESVYFGYAKHHGLKFLTMSFLSSLIGYMYGPISGRENNICVLNLSGLNAQ